MAIYLRHLCGLCVCDGALSLRAFNPRRVGLFFFFTFELVTEKRYKPNKQEVKKLSLHKILNKLSWNIFSDKRDIFHRWAMHCNDAAVWAEGLPVWVPVWQVWLKNPWRRHLTPKHVVHKSSFTTHCLQCVCGK